MFRTLVFVEHVLPYGPDFLFLRKLSSSKRHFRLGNLAVLSTASPSFVVHLVIGWIEENQSAVNGELVQCFNLIVLVQPGQLLE